jgi:putative transposase
LYDWFATDPETAVIEDLSISGMSKKPRARWGAQDGSRGYEARSQLQHRMTMQGSRLHVADRFFPSSRTSSECGCAKGALSLSRRSRIVERGANAPRSLQEPAAEVSGVSQTNRELG